ncbi:MAG: DUF4178 domain-containing protein [Myxococcales bacterium]|nr:DUF4178 domain-containing protein [Myxococcales bacterium]
MVLGQLERSVVVDDIKYGWSEYLLYEQGAGFRWLVLSNGHWTFVEPASAGDLEERGRRIRYRGMDFTHFSSAAAKVDSIRGEFYWKVEVGETVAASDYVSPPHMLSKERAPDEVTWSFATYLPRGQVAHAFSAPSAQTRPRGPHPAQPNPHRPALRGILRAASVFSAALVVLALLGLLFQPGHVVVDAAFEPERRAGAPPGTGRTVSTETFELRGPGNFQISVRCPVTNTWLYVQGRLIDLGSHESRPFGAEVAHYRGVSGGESWSEGGQERTVYLGEVPSGTYQLELEPSWQASATPPPIFRVVAKSRVFLFSHFFIALVSLWVLPLLQIGVYLGFEKKRWSESDHAG